MPISEARRLDLYNAFSESFGAERADTLMALLPTHEIGELATHSDIDRLDGRIDRLEARMDAGFTAVNRRLDRLFLTLGVTLVGMVATVFVQAVL